MSNTSLKPILSPSNFLLRGRGRELTSLEKTYGFLFETRSFLPSPSSSLFPPRIGEVLVVIFLSG